LLSGETPDSHE